MYCTRKGLDTVNTTRIHIQSVQCNCTTQYPSIHSSTVIFMKIHVHTYVHVYTHTYTGFTIIMFVTDTPHNLTNTVFNLFLVLYYEDTYIINSTYIH